MTNWKENSVVWAKYGTYPYWPALVKKIDQTANECEILFFGEDLKGKVNLNAIRKWTPTLTEDEKKVILSDKSMAFAYGIALRFLDEEFEFKHHVKFIGLIDRKKVLKDVRDSLKPRIKKQIHSAQKKAKANKEVRKSASETLKTLKLVKKSIEKDSNKPMITNCITRNQTKKLTLENQTNVETLLSKKRQRDGALPKKGKCIPTKGQKKKLHKEKESKKATQSFGDKFMKNSSSSDMSKVMSDYILKTKDKDSKGIIASLKEKMSHMEVSKNVIQSKFKKIIPMLNELESDEANTQIAINSINNMNQEFRKFYEQNFKCFIEAQRLLFSNLHSQLASLTEGSITPIEQSQKNELEEKANFFQGLTPVSCLALIAQMKTKLTPQIIPPKIAKYLPLYYVLQAMNKEFNDDNLAHVMSSFELFHSEVINGAFLYRSLTNIPNEYQNEAFRLKQRETIKLILNKAFEYLSMTIKASLENNLTNYLELSIAKIDPTISAKYNQTMRKLLQVFKLEFTEKTSLISTILVY